MSTGSIKRAIKYNLKKLLSDVLPFLMQIRQQKISAIIATSNNPHGSTITTNTQNGIICRDKTKKTIIPDKIEATNFTNS